MSLPAGFADAWRGRRVLVTGETGFKGTWLALWLHGLGARVEGLSLGPVSEPSLWEQVGLGELVPARRVDLRDAAAVRAAVTQAAPEAVFHLAAQSLVRASYRDPIETFASNTLGTAHLLEAVRGRGAPCAVVVVTTDKCYENDESGRAFREEDPLGGHDPYSASKACAELVTASYRASFFPSERLSEHGVGLASARAGNVIGPGDWAEDRIVPDCVRALRAGQPVAVRNPGSVRPWQHVLEPLAGYLLLGWRLLAGQARAARAWNFGPDPAASRPVRELVEDLLEAWGEGRWEDRSEGAAAPPEAGLLRLDSGRATAELGWGPVWDFAETVRRTAGGYRWLAEAGSPAAAREVLLGEVAAYTRDAAAAGQAWAEASA